MGEKRNRKKQMSPPKEARAYFSRSSDDDFESKHPIGYKFVVALGIIALLLPGYLYIVTVGVLVGDDSAWSLLGYLGTFIMGIGFFNLVAIIIKQYLGHLVTIVSFVLGSLLVWISLVMQGVL